MMDDTQLSQPALTPPPPASYRTDLTRRATLLRSHPD